MPLCLSFLPHHPNKWWVQGTKHVYVQYEILHNKIDVIIVIEPYHSSFLQAEMFYLLYFMENRHYS